MNNYYPFVNTPLISVKRFHSFLKQCTLIRIHPVPPEAPVQDLFSGGGVALIDPVKDLVHGQVIPRDIIHADIIRKQIAVIPPVLVPFPCFWDRAEPFPDIDLPFPLHIPV